MSTHKGQRRQLKKIAKKEENQELCLKEINVVKEKESHVKDLQSVLLEVIVETEVVQLL